jgi:DNA-binding FadR family transcriptional regulator
LHTTSRAIHLAYTRRFFEAPGAIAETAAQQKAIAEAIGSGDEDAAALAMAAALEYGRRIIEGLTSP